MLTFRKPRFNVRLLVGRITVRTKEEGITWQLPQLLHGKQ